LLALLAQLADVRFGLGEVAAARAYFERALPLACEIGDRASEARLLGSLGLIAGEQGEAEASLALANQAVALSRAFDDGQLLGEQLLFQAMALHDAGEGLAAQAACTEAIGIFERLEASSLLQKAHELREKLAADEVEEDD
jgi:hypothetical protein